MRSAGVIRAVTQRPRRVDRWGSSADSPSSRPPQSFLFQVGLFRMFLIDRHHLSDEFLQGGGGVQQASLWPWWDHPAELLIQPPEIARVEAHHQVTDVDSAAGFMEAVSLPLYAPNPDQQPQAQ